MEWIVGEMVANRWEVHRVLRGGMGLVYIVYDHHPEFRQLYAVKTFQDKIIEGHVGMLNAFRREANVWIGLDAHPNIVRAHYVREISGKPYLFLEYIDGGDLSSWIGSPKLQGNVELVLRLALQFCDGMVHAAARGMVVHRDIKPQNCLLARGSVLKITDFGLAKIFDASDEEIRSPDDRDSSAIGLNITRTGTSMGTPTHMAPEQFDDAKRVDLSADVYSFGVMLFQMAVGRLPFMAQTWSELRKLHQQMPVPNIPNVPTVLQKIVTRCLAKKPTDRFSDFAALHESLSKCYKELLAVPPPTRMIGKELSAFDLCNKGASLASLGFHDRAMEVYREAVELLPEDAKTWINMGASLHQLGRFTEAINCYSTAISIDERAAEAWLNRGLSYRQLNQFGDAKRSILKAIELDPSIQNAWVELARLHVATQEHGLAEKYFEKALQLDTCDTSTLEAFASFLINTKRADRALSLYDAALSVNGRQELVWLNRGVALEELGMPDKALLSYANSTKLNPKSAKAWAYQGNALFKLNRVDEAISAYAQAVQLDPSDAQTWVNQGICFAESKRFRDALWCFERAEQLGHPGGSELIAKCRSYLSR